jgi:hypothetical protein
MFAHPDEAAAIGAIELRTSAPFARRAIADTARMDIMSRDLSVTPASLRRVFDIMQTDGAIGREVKFEPARFVDESYLKESKR